jgi:hypothetical protein
MFSFSSKAKSPGLAACGERFWWTCGAAKEGTIKTAIGQELPVTCDQHGNPSGKQRPAGFPAGNNHQRPAFSEAK